MALAFDRDRYFFFGNKQSIVLNTVPGRVFDAVKINYSVACFDTGFVRRSADFYKTDDRSRISRNSVNLGHREWY